MCKIPKGTLMNRIHVYHCKEQRGQPVLTARKENELVDGLLNVHDLRLLLKLILTPWAKKRNSSRIITLGQIGQVVFHEETYYSHHKTIQQHKIQQSQSPKGSPCCSRKCCGRGTRYNRSTSGWFDLVCFTDWFKTTLVPHAVCIPGPKALIGDNLSSHLTTDLLSLCKANIIGFICLPPNATHLCQPLDFNFFEPIKKVEGTSSKLEEEKPAEFKCG
ncbi:hypothetical protein PR048_011013 [Dryococelus australis]|uniref:DDE-1 domain-containing protein n=1 Tax=Dryococelus australis TaxID=614101 RepID=A0ABQ9HKF6_9NEOP|nr:hypothetical protein PR048_011013 [Dryococelus australis]